jgi:hypothetical protein
MHQHLAPRRPWATRLALLAALLVLGGLLASSPLAITVPSVP